MSDQLLEMIIGNTYDIGIMVGETGNQHFPEYQKKKQQFKNEVIHTMKKEIRTTIKLESNHAVPKRRRIKTGV